MMRRYDSGISSVGESPSADAALSTRRRLVVSVPLLCLVLLLGVLHLDVIKLLALQLVLIFCFLGGAGDARRERSENRSGVLQGSGKSASPCDARENILTVEARAPIRDLAIVCGEQELRHPYFPLMHTKAPEREKLDVGVDVALVEFFLSLVREDVRVPDRPRDNDELKGRGRVRGKDRIA
jgi:hypothetical protein